MWSRLRQWWAHRQRVRRVETRIEALRLLISLEPTTTRPRPIFERSVR